MNRQTTAEVLDNPAWHSLNTKHAHLALGGILAKKYPPEIAPVAALASPDPYAFAELSSLVSEAETVFMLGVEPPVPSSWSVKLQVLMVQMVCHSPIDTSLTGVDILELTKSDVPDMLALTSLTKVGPFRARTYELGTYIGIRMHGELVSMAGEFLYPATYHEIHVVCTHPDFRGRGYASHLVGRLVNSNLEREITPFLLTTEQNEPGQFLYEKLGFVERRRIPMIAVERQD